MRLYIVYVCISRTDRVVVVGNEVTTRSSSVSVAEGTYLLDDRVLTDGVVFAYSAYFISNKPVRFQVWRPVVNGTENVYRLVGQTRVRPSQTYSREDVSAEYRCTVYVSARY